VGYKESIISWEVETSHGNGHLGWGRGGVEVWSCGVRPETLPRIGWQTPMYRSTVKVTVSQTAVLLHVLPSDMTWPR